uniref:G_PROTEIN_RECEP_F1_2 domain-containing protein n=1 Tax=Anisakis simplex TaxID=6269 RepID=A0A0M3J8E6_ANISI
LERLAATLYVKTYEKRFKSPIILICIWGSPLLVAILLKTLFLVIPDGRSRTIVPVVIMSLLDATAIVMGLVVLYRNKKMYEEAFLSGTEDLTTRYQTSENIKTTR